MVKVTQPSVPKGNHKSSWQCLGAYWFRLEGSFLYSKELTPEPGPKEHEWDFWAGRDTDRDAGDMTHSGEEGRWLEVDGVPQKQGIS